MPTRRDPSVSLGILLFCRACQVEYPIDTTESLERLIAIAEDAWSGDRVSPVRVALEHLRARRERLHMSTAVRETLAGEVIHIEKRVA